MSIELSVSTGGLVFEVTPLLDADRIETLLAPALADHGYPVQSVSSIGVIGLQVTCDKLLLWFNLENRSYAPPRLRVTAQPMGAADNPAEAASETEAEDTRAILAVTLALLARDLGATAVNWLSKDVSIPAGRFIDAALPIRPRRVATHPHTERPQRLRLAPGEVTLPEIGDFPVAPRRISSRASSTPRPKGRNRSREIGLDFSLKLRELRRKEEQIADAIQSDLSLPLRVSAWIMTILVGIFSAPVAWVLFAFNLNRGGDFRVTANVLAATAGLSLLHAAGVTEAFLAMVLN